MIAVILAALLVNATPMEASLKASQPVVETVSETTSGAILAGVAVTLECTAHTDGHVDGCRVLGETHPGLGFGEAAIALMRGAEVEPGPREIQFARTIQFTP